MFRFTSATTRSFSCLAPRTTGRCSASARQLLHGMTFNSASTGRLASPWGGHANAPSMAVFNRDLLRRVRGDAWCLILFGTLRKGTPAFGDLLGSWPFCSDGGL